MRFFKIPTNIVLSQEIDATEFRIITVVMSLSSEEQKLGLSISKISEFSGISRRHVIRKISRLTKRSFLTKTKNGKSFNYTVNFNKF